MEHAFRQLDELVLHLKGLVLVRKVRETQGADAGELALFSAEIDRVREQLAEAARPGAAGQVAG